MNERNTVTISFRAKRDRFAGGVGYKVPSLVLGKHVSVKDRDMAGQTLMSCRDDRVTDARLANLLGGRLPGVVWEDVTKNDAPWVITPRGTGFMADVTVTVPLTVRTMRGK